MQLKSRWSMAAIGASLVVCGAAQADLVEGFDDITALAGNGWVMTNSSDPVGTNGWFQGNPDEFGAAGGPVDSYIGASYQNTGTSGPNTISNWLITPEMTLNNGDVLTFYTRTIIDSLYPDRLQVRMSTEGSSTDVGASATDTGDFSYLLLSVNPTLDVGGFPESWAQYSVTVSGLSAPTSGRLAFRYFVENAGPVGDNSNYFGIDSFEYAQVPGAGGLLLLAGFVGVKRRRRRTA